MKESKRSVTNPQRLRQAGLNRNGVSIGMPKFSTNIYQKARQLACMTQEVAAERIHKSVESIRAYECDIRVPDDDTVLLMVDEYKAPHLAIEHLRNTSELARRIMPEVQKKDLPSAVLSLLKEVNDLIQCRDDLIAIGSDGVISDDERQRWDEIMKEFDEAKAAIIALEYAV